MYDQVTLDISDWLGHMQENLFYAGIAEQFVCIPKILQS